MDHFTEGVLERRSHIQMHCQVWSSGYEGRRGIAPWASVSDDEPLVPARNVVARVQATQIDPELSQPMQEERFHRSLLMSSMLWSMTWHHTQFSMWRRHEWMRHHLCMPRNSMLSWATPMLTRRQVQLRFFLSTSSDPSRCSAHLTLIRKRIKWRVSILMTSGWSR